MAYHNSWPYFAKRFGIHADLYLEPKPGIPPTPTHLAEVVKTMNEEKIRVILLDPYFNPKTAESVARQTNAKVVPVTHFPGGVKGTEAGYVELIDYLVDAVTKALGETKP